MGSFQQVRKMSKMNSSRSPSVQKLKINSSKSTRSMSPNIEVVDINEVSKSMSFVESNLRFRKRRSKKKPLGQAMSSLDSARFKSTPESDEIRVENDEQPIEPAISIFDLIENEKSKTGIEK